MTAEWVAGQGFVLGNSIDAPWVITDSGLKLWFESDGINSGIEDVWGEEANGNQAATRKMIINGQMLIIRDGKVYNVMGARL